MVWIRKKKKGTVVSRLFLYTGLFSTELNSLPQYTQSGIVGVDAKA
jgi:hypothetical protein